MSDLDYRLKEFIDRAIVPALLERFLAARSVPSVDAEPVTVLPSSPTAA
jgi:hypothetical protein